MRIAICFSGQIRTGVESSKNIKRFIGDLYPYCDFFIHTWNVNSQKQMYGENVDYDMSEVSISTLNNIKSIYDPKEFYVDDFFGERIYSAPLFYSWMRSVEYMTKYEESNNFEYDYVVKFRFDNIFSSDVSLINFINMVRPNMFICENIWINIGQITIDDVFFLSESNIMKKASVWYSYLNNKENIIYNIGESIGENAYFAKYLIENGIYLFNSRLSEFKNLTICRTESLKYFNNNEFKKCYEFDKIFYFGSYVNEILTID